MLVLLPLATKAMALLVYDTDDNDNGNGKANDTSEHRVFVV